MNLSVIFNNAKKSVKSNSPEILTSAGVSGVVITSYLTAKASFQAAEVLREVEDVNLPDDETKRERVVRRTKLLWKLYIPSAVSGAVTIGCVLGASKASNHRTAAAVSAYSISERAFSEYREKVVEQIGKNKEEKLFDEIRQDKVDKSPPTEVIISGGDVLCCELFTGRYFKSDMERLRKAQNDINQKINNELYVTLDEFYDLIGLPHTSTSNKQGWDSTRLMELSFTTTLSPDGTPCLAFDYNYVKPL